MVMSRSYTNKQEVAKVTADYLKCRLALLKHKFNIEHLEFDVSILDFPKDKDGYKINEIIKGSTLIDWTVPKVEEIIFYTQNISDYMELKFSIIHDSAVFGKVLEIVIEFVLIHELVHVKQVDDGLTIEEYELTIYEDNKYEKEANEKAAEFLSEEGAFYKEIAEFILHRGKTVNNENVSEIINLFYGG